MSCPLLLLSNVCSCYPYMHRHGLHAVMKMDFLFSGGKVNIKGVFVLQRVRKEQSISSPHIFPISTGSQTSSKLSFSLASACLVCPAAKIAELLLAIMERESRKTFAVGIFPTRWSTKWFHLLLAQGSEKKQKTNRHSGEGPTTKPENKKIKRMVTNGSSERCIILPFLFALERLSSYVTQIKHLPAPRSLCIINPKCLRWYTSIMEG